MKDKERLFFERIKEEKKLTKESEFLFDFATKIGSLITFIMLKAVETSKGEKNGKEKE